MIVFLPFCSAPCGCRGPETNAEKLAAIEQMYAEFAGEFGGAADITVAEVMEAQKTEKIVLVDVRERKETDVSMIPGAITKEQFERDIDSYRDHRIVTHCTVGYRSGLYAKKLHERGYRVANLKGAILSWTHSGGDLANEQGPTRKVHVYGSKWNLAAEGYEPVW